MSRREDIDNAIWTDPDFEALSPNATLLFLWSWTNLRCGMAGIYKVSERAMAESKVPADAIPAALEELSAAGFAFYEDSVLWVRSRVKHLRSRSPQMAKSIANDLEKVSERHPLRRRFLAEYGGCAWLRKDLARPSVEGMPNLSENPVGKPDSDTLPRPSREGPGQGDWQGPRSRTSTTEVELPDGFPRELEPHLAVVQRVLAGLAERHGGRAVSRLSLAAVIMARSHKPLVRAAYDCAAHWDGRPARVKDVVAAYRNWLDRTDDMAGFERLGENGLPSGVAGGGNVVAMRQQDPVIARKNAYRKDVRP